MIRRFYEDVLVGGDLDALDEIATADYQEHDPLPGQGEGLRGLKNRVTMLKEGLAVRFTIEDVIQADDKLVVRWTNSGTHVGEFLGIPPCRCRKLDRVHAARSYSWIRPPRTSRLIIGPGGASHAGEGDLGAGGSISSERWGRWPL